MPRLKRLSWLLLLAVLILGLLVWFVLRASPWPAYRVQRADLSETVVASGRVIPPAMVELASMVNGTVAEVRGEEGDACRKGELLVQLDEGELRAQLRNTEAQLAQAEARLAQLGTLTAPQAAQTVEQARSSLTLAERTLARNRELARTGFVSPAAVDEAQQQVELAASRLRSAQTGLSSSQAGSERQLAQAGVRAAQAAVQLAQAKLQQLSLRAPADCRVLLRSVEVGQVAQVGKPLLTLALNGPTRISMLVDEKRLGYLAVGQAARVLADAFPEQPFDATVSSIAPGVDRDTGTVEVKLAVAKPPAFLRADMTVSAEVRVASRPQVLQLPSDAVLAGNGEPAVWLVRDGEALRQPVRLGLNGVGRVEVRAGLSEGDIVLAPGSKPITAGMAVRPQVAQP